VLFKRDVVLAQEYLGFLLLNLFDLFLTGYIFRHHGQEGNGLAAWILATFHLRGFAIYKFLLVLVVVLACEGVTLQSVRKAKIIITAGCLLYLAVVIYECVLIFTAINGSPNHAPVSPTPAFFFLS
jgi:hypothetical protein